MSEPTPDAPPAEEPQVDGATPDTDDGPKDLEAELARVKAHARKWEERAKANKVAADRLEQLERERMTDEEKARTEAFEGGRAAERTALTERLVAAEFKAAAALAGRDVNEVAGLLEDLNVSRFLTADGEVDTERITARVSALPVAAGAAQEPVAPRLPDLGQGRRNPAPVNQAEEMAREQLERHKPPVGIGYGAQR
jgi:hypothetical protein